MKYAMNRRNGGKDVKATNKVTMYRQGCIKFCDMYVEELKRQNESRECPKKLHPYSGMEVHETAGEKESFCNNVIECSLCYERHYEGYKSKLLSEYDVRRNWRDKE